MNELKETLEALCKQMLSKLQLVTREEFEVQKKVLARTREKLEALEKQQQMPE